jgi:16S rRNA (guanine966-N2)-methyltransferase
MIVQKHNIRIIGGLLRGRKLKVLDQNDLRPTSNRLRETLFNWLMPFVNNSLCLDLFTGSGALGIEAISRGAKQVYLLDNNLNNIKNLHEICKILKIKANIIHTDSLKYITNNSKDQFNIVFLDPPFANINFISESIILLEQNNFLAKESYIYIEIEYKQKLPNMPKNWQLIKQKQVSQVQAYLYKRLENVE